MIKTSEAASAEVAPQVAQEQDPPNVRVLKYVVVVLGVLLIGCFVAVFAIIGYRLANPRAETSRSQVNEIALPVGTGMNVSEIALDGDRMAVHLKGGSGEEVIVFDIRRGRILSRVRLESPPLAAQP